MMNKLFIYIGLLVIFYSCSIDIRHSEAFDIDGSGKIVLVNESDDSVKITIENWLQIPWKLQLIDTVITKDAVADFELKMQGNNYYKIRIGDKDVKLFSQPNSLDSIIILNNNEVQYSGTFKSINNFLYDKLIYFKSIDAESLPRTNLTHGNTTATELLERNDSITKIHIDYLESHKETLPSWYVDFEINRLKYLTIDWKTRSIWYRRNFLGTKDSLPSDFLSKSIRNLNIEDSSFLGNESYMRFLSSYISLKSNLFYSATKPNSKEDFKTLFRSNFDTIEKEFKGELKDVLLAYEIGKIIESQRHYIEEPWLDMVVNENYKNYLKGLYHSNLILPKGSKLPFFSLLDANDIRYESSQFKGKVLLINFWATWCQPCIEEFPYENELVDQFQNEPVKIINICIESDSTKWSAMIDNLQLKTLNLYSTNSWDETLSKDFGIQSLPHTTLVDRDGTIVQNKCPRASEGIDRIIRLLLTD